MTVLLLIFMLMLLAQTVVGLPLWLALGILVVALVLVGLGGRRS